MTKRVHRKRRLTKAEKQRDAEVRARFASRPSQDELPKREFTRPIKQGEYLAVLGFAAALKRMRLQSKLSLAQLARRSGIDAAAINRLENGLTANPTVGTLERLARSLGRRIEIDITDP